MSGYELTARKKDCPACGKPSDADAVLCTKCGRNFETGARAHEAERDPADAQRKAALLKKARANGGLDAEAAISAGVMADPALACPNCGYDLKGLAGRPCPECGQTPAGRRRGGIRGDREERRAAEITRYWRNSVLIGLIGGVSGAAVMLGIVPLLTSVPFTECLLVLGACEVSIFVGCFAMCFFFIGFEEDLRGLALRLVGVGAVWAVLQLLIGLMPFSGMYWIAGGAIARVALLALPLQSMTGRDWDDSFWIAAASWVLCTGVLLVAYALI